MDKSELCSVLSVSDLHDTYTRIEDCKHPWLYGSIFCYICIIFALIDTVRFSFMLRFSKVDVSAGVEGVQDVAHVAEDLMASLGKGRKSKAGKGLRLFGKGFGKVGRGLGKCRMLCSFVTTFIWMVLAIIFMTGINCLK